MNWQLLEQIYLIGVIVAAVIMVSSAIIWTIGALLNKEYFNSPHHRGGMADELSGTWFGAVASIVLWPLVVILLCIVFAVLVPREVSERKRVNSPAAY